MRRLSWGALVAASVIIAAAGEHPRATGTPHSSLVLQRFLAADQSAPAQYRALRHITARNDRLNADAWMDVWTDADAAGFRYEIVASGGSGYIRSHVFEPALETERDVWEDRETSRALISKENYEFGECAALNAAAAGLASDPALNAAACVGLKARRKDVLLVDGSIFLKPEDGDLVGIRGALTKNPSFWTRRVEISRRYDRIAGIRVPIALETVANVRFAGTSTLTMTYEYETVNGRRVGNPEAAPRPEAASR